MSQLVPLRPLGHFWISDILEKFWANWDIFEFQTFLIKVILQTTLSNNWYFWNKTDPPSVFKTTKFKLGHFWGGFSPPPPIETLSQIFSIFYFDASPKSGLTWNWLCTPTTTTHCHKLNVSNISAVITRFDQTWKIGSLDHLEQIPSVTVTFVHATFVHVTFVHIRNISAVTDLIFTRL